MKIGIGLSLPEIIQRQIVIETSSGGDAARVLTLNGKILTLNGKRLVLNND